MNERNWSQLRSPNMVTYQVNEILLKKQKTMIFLTNTPLFSTLRHSSSQILNHFIQTHVHLFRSFSTAHLHCFWYGRTGDTCMVWLRLLITKIGSICVAKVLSIQRKSVLASSNQTLLLNDLKKKNDVCDKQSLRHRDYQSTRLPPPPPPPPQYEDLPNANKAALTGTRTRCGVQVDSSKFQIDGFTNFMHTILTKVVPDNLKACLRFVRRSSNLCMQSGLPGPEGRNIRKFD